MFTPDTAKTITLEELFSTKGAGLTESQRAAVRSEFAKIHYADGGDSYTLGLFFDRWKDEKPAMFRIAPNAEQLTAALVGDMTKKLGIERVGGQDKIKLFRRVAKMNDDERLDASVGLKIDPVEQRKTEPTTVASGDDALDAEAARRGGHASVDAYRAATLASRILENRRQLKKQSAQPSSPVLTEAKARGQSLDHASDDFQRLLPSRRIALFRAQQKAAAK